MAGEEESDGIKLFLQPLGGQPWLDLGQPQCTARGAVAERELERTTFLGLVCAVRLAQHGIDGGKHARAVALERLECAGSRETFQHALVDRARIDAGREVGEVVNGRSPRAATIASTAWVPTPLRAASE